MPEEMLFVENLDDLIKTLGRRAPVELVRAIERGMDKSVVDVVGWTKRNAPVDTGRLRSSIAGEVKATFGEVRGIIGTNVEYAPYVEQPGPVRRTGRRPYLRPAIEEHVRELMNNFERVIKAAFDKLGFK